MKYVAVAIIVIIIGVMVGASVRGTQKEALQPTSPPPGIAVTENPNIRGETQEPQKTPQLTIIKNMEKQGVTIDVLKEGMGPEIKSGNTAVVHYTGQLVDGKVFDTSRNKGQPFEFLLGSGFVIKGWDIGVEGMKKGEIRKLTIPPNLAYGASGIPGAIPPNATLIFEVELVSIK